MKMYFTGNGQLAIFSRVSSCEKYCQLQEQYGNSYVKITDTKVFLPDNSETTTDESNLILIFEHDLI